MDISENLAGVLGNIVRNRAQVETNRKQVATAVGQLDEVSLASIKQLLNKFEHPQAISQFVNAVVQAEGLDRAAAEMDTAIAVLQAAADDDSFILQAQAQLEANDAAANSPLSAAGQSGESAPADQGNADLSAATPAA